MIPSNPMEGIHCGGFGAHDWYEKNERRCKRIKAEAWCDHCHKEMTVGTGWVVNWNWSDDALYPVTGKQYEWRLVGTECIKKFLTKDQYPIYTLKQG